MTDELRFDGRVVIVTGAGNGLGRAHALLFGARGAKVLVNDLGGSAFGDGRSTRAADAVVEEIRSAGGEAVANYESVADGEGIVAAALEAFGRVDVVVNNAGILRDVTFHKMTGQDWDLIFDVHVRGAFAVTHAAWPHMREQGYGRVIFTSSAAGLYGNFGQTNYGAAKLAQLGMSNTLALEGRKAGILVNTIAPIAGSRLTETVMPKQVTDALRPDAVSPLVAWLAHESCDDTGGVYEVGGGFFAKVRWQRTAGKSWRIGRPLTPELVRDHWSDITRFDEDARPVLSIQESTAPVFDNIQKGPTKGANRFIDADLALGYEMPPVKSRYDERELVLYALGIGAGRDPLSPFDLSLVYEGHSGGFRAFPTYAVIPALNAIMELTKEGKTAPGMNYGLDRLLHGEQYLELKRPLPTSARLEHRAKVKEIWDKGKSAVLVTAVTTVDEAGETLAYNEITSFIRGAGGFGGDRGPSAEVNLPPDRAPDLRVEEKTDRAQALLYRQAGDWNPLHADPGFAKAFGFPEPILHGLCTFGFSVRHVLRAYAPDGNPSYFRSVKVRFADSVFPGETLITEMWRESPTRIVFRTKVAERDSVVISNAAIELFAELPAPRAKVEESTAAAAKSTQQEARASIEPRDVFAVMNDYLVANPDVSKRVGTVYGFRLSNPEAYFTVDARSGTGASEGETQKAQCTMELSTADFLALTRGEANPQKLFSSGKLKIGGDMMAAMKLDFLTKLSTAEFQKKADARAGSGSSEAALAQTIPEAVAGPSTQAASADTRASRAEATAGGGQANAPELVAAMRAGLAAAKGAASGAIVLRVLDPDAVFTVDFGTGSVTEGAAKGVETLVTIRDADLPKLRSDTPLASLFQRGVVRVDGPMAPIHQLALLARL